MIKVIGVRFKKTGKIYYFDPKELKIKEEDNVIVETARGLEFGTCIIGIREIPEDQVIMPLKPVIKVATVDDIKKYQDNKRLEKDAFNICDEKISKHNLEMKLIDVEYTFDNNKIIFYFTAEGRVDFRELVKDLATVFRTRIELRQIGVRDEAKMLGGIGPCGRTLCCSTFLGDFAPVSIKMAKEQNLSLNPAKISGICGRLMCCLNYEQETYEETRKKLPVVDSLVETPYGNGVVISNNTVKEQVVVRIKNVEGDDYLEKVSIHELKLLKGSFEGEIEEKYLKIEIEDEKDAEAVKGLLKKD